MKRIIVDHFTQDAEKEFRCVLCESIVTFVTNPGHENTKSTRRTRPVAINKELNSGENMKRMIVDHFTQDAEKNFVVFLCESIVTFVTNKGHEEHKVDTKDMTCSDNQRVELRGKYEKDHS